MKWAFLLVANLFAFNAMSQMRTIQGQIIDEYEKGIPFAVVQAKEQNIGVYCDSNGEFSLRINTDSIKRIIFYCMGYNRREIAVKDIPDGKIHIKLQEENIKLDEVAVKWKKRKVREAILGKKNISNKEDPFNLGANGKYGDEYAIFLKADLSRHSILKNVFVFVTDEGIPTTKFRMHVYDKDSATWMPLHDITDSNIIIHADHGNEWVKVDLSNKQIPVNDGVFISIEWVSGYGNDSSIRQSTPVAYANGQVIGMTEGYNNMGFISVERLRFTDKWITMGMPFNLEIYGTYTYVKK